MRPQVSRSICLLVCVLVFGISTLAASNAVPLLNPVVPSATAPGGAAFSLSVTGTGFVSGSAVNWNGSPRTTTFVSSSKLSAAITAADIAVPSTSTITVVSPGPGGGTSNAQFFEVAYATSIIYFSSRDVTGQVNLTSPVAGGDFNKDGKQDLVVASGGYVYVLAGNGDGTFQPAVGSAGPTNSTITQIQVADVNGDGKLDLIVSGAKSTTAFVATMLGNGNGTFQAPIETDFSGTSAPSMVLADFNGDGILDLAYTTALSVQTLLGNGDGTFHVGPSTALTQIARAAVAVGDFNVDGKIDLVISAFDPSSQGFNYIATLPGNGDGSFGSLTQVPGSGTSFVGAITAVVGDFNGDGKLDIATAIQTSGSLNQGFINISIGNGDGTFQAASSVPNVGTVTTPLLLGDFNGDGHLDLATGGFFYFGQGDGTFPVMQGSSGAPTFVLAGDLNGDGNLDVVDATVTLHGSTVLTALGLELQIPPTPDFKGVVSPLSTALVPGGSVSFSINLTPLYGFTGDVTIGASGLPAGITPSYSPVTVHGGSGTAIVTLTASGAVQLGSYTVTLTGSSGNITHSSTLPLNVVAVVGDFAGSVSPTTQNITLLSGVTMYTVSISPIGGFTAPVDLTASGLPPGATSSFSQPTITGGTGTSTLQVNTSGTTPAPSISAITITGTSGPLTHSTIVYLGVTSTGGNFTGTITPSQTVTAGSNATYSVGLQPLEGGAGDVTLTVSGLPAGATGVFSPTVITGGSGSSTLTVTTTTGTTPPGTYSLLVTMTGSGVLHQSAVTLTVD